MCRWRSRPQHHKRTHAEHQKRSLAQTSPVDVALFSVAERLSLLDNRPDSFIPDGLRERLVIADGLIHGRQPR
jgi:hypothetical protein